MLPCNEIPNGNKEEPLKGSLQLLQAKVWFGLCSLATSKLLSLVHYASTFIVKLFCIKDT